jgi:hypothetical protein
MLKFKVLKQYLHNVLYNTHDVRKNLQYLHIDQYTLGY